MSTDNENLFDGTRCDSSKACDDELCQAYIAGRHVITESLYNHMVFSFFGSTTIPTQEYPLVDIERLLNNDCGEYCIEFTADYTDTTSNSDIVLTASTNFQSDKYSIALLKGVILLTSPDTFCFSKANDGSGDTVIFKALQNSVIVYCGDISSIYP